MIYDLIVVGNGLAAQTFLFELFKKLDVNKSQNFSVAQVYSEDIAASCSLRSTATVSLSGIEEGISELGNELRESFFLFEEFHKKYQPLGIEKVNRLVTFTNEKDKSKLIRRYKHLQKFKHPILVEEVYGVEVDSFLIGPSQLNSWFNQQISHSNFIQKINFVKKITKNELGIIECELLNNEIFKTKNIVLCTGAFAKIFSAFHETSAYLENTQIIAGSFLERSVNLNMPSFYVTIDGYNLIYRNNEQKLILGSASQTGAMAVADHTIFEKILGIFNQKCNFPIGERTDFKIVTGLRHKGSKRRPIASALDVEKNIFMINGLYKNGYTFSHLCAKKILSEINLFAI